MELTVLFPCEKILLRILICSILGSIVSSIFQYYLPENKIGRAVFWTVFFSIICKKEMQKTVEQKTKIRTLNFLGGGAGTLHVSKSLLGIIRLRVILNDGKLNIILITYNKHLSHFNKFIRFKVWPPLHKMLCVARISAL